MAPRKTAAKATLSGRPKGIDFIPCTVSGRTPFIFSLIDEGMLEWLTVY